MSSAVQQGDILAGKYVVERVLGSGGMGVVVSARHVDLDALRAIKILRREMLEHASSVKRFLQEAQAATRLQSEHVVRVYDVGKLDEGAPYIVMEHLVGADLRSVLEWHGPLPIKEAVLCVLQACDAIIEAHAQGIIHRDLKPANLFLTTRPNGLPCVKVLDFGIAKVLERRDTSPEISATATLLGSPAYMAPEQARSSSPVDARTDVWALGLILYELLTGQKAFSGQTAYDVLLKILEAAPTLPSTYRPDMPPGLEAVTMWCLEKDPARRMQSAMDLKRALLPFGPRQQELSLESRNDLDEVTMIQAPKVVMEEVMGLSTKTLPPAKLSAAVEAAPAMDALPAARAEMPREVRPTRGRAGLRGFVATLLITVLLGGAALLIWQRYFAQPTNAPQPEPTTTAPSVVAVESLPIIPVETSVPASSAEPGSPVIEAQASAALPLLGSQPKKAPPRREGAETDTRTTGDHSTYEGLHQAKATSSTSSSALPAPSGRASSSPSKPGQSKELF